MEFGHPQIQKGLPRMPPLNPGVQESSQRILKELLRRHRLGQLRIRPTDLFDHLLAILPEFDLRAFQEITSLPGPAVGEAALGEQEGSGGYPQKKCVSAGRGLDSVT